jgi:hypothetical protein
MVAEPIEALREKGRKRCQEAIRNCIFGGVAWFSQSGVVGQRFRK